MWIKYLYKMLRDDLKDAACELCYAEAAKEENEKSLMKYFGEAAAYRLNTSFTTTYTLLKEQAENTCLWEAVQQEIEEEHEHLQKRLEQL